MHLIVQICIQTYQISLHFCNGIGRGSPTIKSGTGNPVYLIEPYPKDKIKTVGLHQKFQPSLSIFLKKISI